MAIVATISRTQLLRMEEWLACVAVMDELIPHAPRKIVNPFTGQPTVAYPNIGSVTLTVAGTHVGAIEPSSEFDTDGELLVYSAHADSPAFRKLVAEVAKALGASIEWIPE